MDDRKVLELYPLPFARAYRRYRNATELSERHDAGYYLYEVYLKYAAAVAIAHYLAGDSRDHRVNATLKGLAKPSLGEWVRFLRECARFLAGTAAPAPAIRALAELLERRESSWAEVVRLCNGMRSFTSGRPSDREACGLGMLLEELVAYRNRVIGHGAPPSREHRERFGELFGRAFPQLLDRSPFLTALRLVSFDSVQVEEGERIECTVFDYMGTQPLRRPEPLTIPYGSTAPARRILYLLGEGGSFVSLHPLLLAHDEDVYILNEAAGAPEYLSYATGGRYAPPDLAGAQGELFRRILGYEVDASGLSRISLDLSEVERVIGQAATGRAAARRLGDFRIVRELGSGGMGTVFEAVQESLGRRVALKVLPGSFALDPKRVERFRREARATARIHHPNIIPVYEVGEAEGTHYYAMEYIDGPSLDALLAPVRQEAQGRKDKRGSSTADPAHIARTAAAVAALAEGLGEAHALGLIHRDVKPSNILVDPGGRYVLVDFGLVHDVEAQALTRSGEMLGTLKYMSPEQVSRRPVDARSDVYSLGVTLYETLTGRCPFEGESEHEIQNGILFKEPVGPRRLHARIHRDLETIVLHAMEKDPDRRYSSAAALADDLRRFLRYEPIRAKPQSLLTRIGRRAWKQKGRIAAAGLVLAALLALFLFYREHSKRRLAEYEPRVKDAAMKLQVSRLALRNRGETMRVPFQLLTGLTDVQALVRDRGIDPVERALDELAEAASIQPDRPDAYYHRARAFQLLGDEEKAIGELDRALRGDPSFVPGRILRASILDGAEKDAETAEEIRVAGGAGLRDWAEASLSAHRAVREKRWNDAAAAYGRLIAAKTADGREPYLGATFESYVGRGVARLESGKLSQALQDFAGARAEWPGALEPELLTGKTYLLMREPENAEEHFAGLFEDSRYHPDEVALGVAAIHLDRFEYEKALAWVEKIKLPYLHHALKASILMNLGMPEGAFGAASEAVKERPDDARMHQMLAQTLCDGVQNFPEALRAIGRAIELDPQDIFLRLIRLEILSRFEQTAELVKEAVSLTEQVVAMPGGKDGPCYMMLGDALVRAGRVEEAFAAYDTAVDLDPKNPSVFNNIGAACLRLGMFGEAVKAFDRAIEIEPRWSWPRRGRGYALLQSGALDDAIGALKKTFSTSTYPKESRNYTVAAWASARCGKLSDAIDMLRTAEAAFRERYDPHITLGPLSVLGGYYFLKGDRAAALAWFEKEIAAKPSCGYLEEFRGRALECEGRVREACAAYGAAVVKDYTLPGAHGRLAHFLRTAAGNPECAAELAAPIDRIDRLAAAGERLTSAALRTVALGRAYLPDRKDVARAVKLTRQILAGPVDPEGLALAAEILAEAGSVAEAVTSLERAIRLPGADPALALALERYRERLAPDVASIASIDAILASARTEILVRDDATWRFFRGIEGPPADWCRLGFDAAGWETGRGGFGCGLAHPQRRTGLEGMVGSYTSLYARHEFQVDDPGRFAGAALFVWADDGFAAYLNGEEVGRARAGTPGAQLSHTASATAGSNGRTACRIEIDARRLRTGANCLALHGLNKVDLQTSFFLAAVLAGRVAPDPAACRGLLDRLSGEDRRDRRLYLEGRLRQGEKRHRDAAGAFAKLIEVAPKRPEPLLRLAESLRAADDAVAAEEKLRAAFALFPGEREVWDLWWSIAAVDLRWSPQDMRAAVPASLPEGCGTDIAWIVARLAEGTAIRINCGGEACAGPGGEEWSADRFFLGGAPFAWDQSYFRKYVSTVPAERFLQSERSFGEGDVRGYRIPLPPGTARVTLHFADVKRRDRGTRRFDVLVQGKRELEDYEPPANGEAKTFRDVPVEDGFLEIGFGRRLGDPGIAGIEIDVAGKIEIQPRGRRPTAPSPVGGKGGG